MTDPITSSGARPGGTGNPAYVALAILFFVSLFNYMDRYMLAVLIPSIKADLDLSDTQIGIITGLAFTLFYATMGIPIARLADQYSRRKIIAIALALWSLMTGLCGLAQNFVQLAATRVLVGVGEAGSSPPSQSIIADLFPIKQRARAISSYTLGAPVGILFGFLLGGWLAEFYSWRFALFAVAAPGLVYSLVVLKFLREPPRGQADGLTASVEMPSFKDTAAALWKNRTFMHISFATGLYTVLWLGVVQWIPSYFTRSFDLKIGMVGSWLAIILSSSQIVGMLAGGWLADSLGKRDLRWYLWLPAAAMFFSTPIFAVTFLTNNPTIAFVSLWLPFAIGVMQGPASFAITQGIVNIRMRAMAVAVYLCITNAVGGGLGPLAIGATSDWLAPTYGDESLRYSLLWVALFFGLWASLHYYLASRTVHRDIEVHASE